jgi:DNA invertase Pin-like site-specific DNA recombinase
MKRARPGDPKQAVAYLRVSTDEQRLGPEAQRATVEAWAVREGVTALFELRAAKAGVLVVAKRDRIARDVAVAAMIDRAVRSSGAKVVSADGVGNGDTPADGFMRSILDAAAAYERELIRARTRAALAVKRSKGERAGEVPYGFRAQADGRLEVEPDEQNVIVAIRELRVSGVSLRRVVLELEARGFLSRSGKPLQLTQVARIARAEPIRAA